ncbi:hypothetical protein RUND412_000043 [Rhizina undulata]
MAEESVTAAGDSKSFITELYANNIKEYSFDLEALRRWMICFFPERTNSDTIEDSLFHFRFRHSSPDVEYEHTDDDPAHWYGFCLFRQQRDTTVKRNYRQKSLVLVSQHNFAPLFEHLVKTISMLDFAASPSLIEAACSNMAAWGGPEVGLQELPFLGSLLDVHIPPHHAFPLQGLVTATPSKTDIRVEYKEIHTSEPVGSWARLAHLLTSVSELYIIFERVLLAEPLVALADDPSTCSEFVSAAVDLIRPIPYGGDSRPYLTMQSDFILNPNEGIPLRHYLIGITNPFFLKRLLAPSKENSQAHVVYLAGPEVKKRHLIFYSSSDYGSNLMSNDTKGFIAKDLVFLRRLENYLKEPDVTPLECGRFVRRHFALLSALFLAPLNRYLATLTSTLPDSKKINIGSFSEEDFLASLSKHGCSVQFKGNTSFNRHKTAETFYRKFCRSPGFFCWLEMKMRLQNADAGSYVGNGRERNMTESGD